MNYISNKKENDYGTDHKLCKTGTHRSSNCLIFRRNGIKAGYTAYHNLGGNDVATELYHKLLGMPEEQNESEE